MTRLFIVVATLLAGLVLLAGPSQAAGRCWEREIQLDRPAPASLARNPRNDVLFDTIAAVLRDDLGLPLPTPLKTFVCRDEAALDEALYRNLGTLHGAGYAMGIATPAGAFFRGDYLVNASLRARVDVIAHELAHMSQLRLATGRVDRVPMWIREGHAVWAAFRILDLLAVRPYRDSRADIVLSLGAVVTPVDRLPDLDALAGPGSWNRGLPRYAATYGQAFLAVERLIERSSRATPVELLRLPPEPVDFNDHWAKVSPIPYREFAEDFRLYLRTVVRQ